MRMKSAAAALLRPCDAAEDDDIDCETWSVESVDDEEEDEDAADRRADVGADAGLADADVIEDDDDRVMSSGNSAAESHWHWLRCFLSAVRASRNTPADACCSARAN